MAVVLGNYIPVLKGEVAKKFIAASKSPKKIAITERQALIYRQLNK